MPKRQQKILVVDDTEATRYAVARTLLKNGFDVIEAATGKEALKRVQEELPDLVTLDIHLPDILGFEVCRQIKADPRTSYIPVLQVSASYVTSKDRIHGLEGGADSYLTHPFEPPVLVATVKALLRGQDLFEKLRESEEHFRVALKNAPIMIYTCNTDLKITWIHNQPPGLEKAPLLGKQLNEVFQGPSFMEVVALKRTVLSGGRGLRSIKTLQVNNEPVTYDMTIEPLTNASGKISGLTVACIDISERVQSELALRNAMENAELANHAKSRFLSNMSHEIRTPLGVIQGFSELALDEKITPEERAEYLQTIKRNASELTKLIGEILDLAKIESGQSQTELIRFPFIQLLEDVMSALSLQAKEKGLTLSLKLQQPFPHFVTTDPTKTRQVLLNLISNSIKFTSRGGIDISCKIENKTSEKPSLIRIEVKDSGIGLSPEQGSRLFQAFSQADSSTTRKFGGTGLGLDLSRKLAQSLGGNVELVESEIGVGSTFSFTFDPGILATEDFQSKNTTALPKYSANDFFGKLTGLKVLLVDDSADNQMLFSKYLSQTGASVSTASDGFEAVRLAEKSIFDVVLMDIQMPGIDGYETTARLRSMGVQAPVIALTANALKEEREKAISLGFDGYLTKPVNPVHLILTLEQYLDL